MSVERLPGVRWSRQFFGLSPPYQPTSEMQLSCAWGLMDTATSVRQSFVEFLEAICRRQRARECNLWPKCPSAWLRRMVRARCVMVRCCHHDNPFVPLLFFVFSL
ncbi:unnamed protein product [Durusdinium trenchii]|uniref:Uncharacterized protein n=2 Tax=Durusdinium trenchii TaxID=1381693 RepID=A0ABP0Q5L6_9DINO